MLKGKKMKLKLLNTLGLLVLAASFVSGAFAQQATLNLVNANADYAVFGNGGGVYTDPYTFSITQGSVTSTGVLLSCDDFLNDVFVGESWTTNVTSLQANILGEAAPNQTVYYDKTDAAAQQLQYSEVAYLAANLAQWGSANGYGTQTAAEYSFAIWDIFAPTAVANFMSGGVTHNGVTLVNFANDVAADVSAAQSFVQGGGVVANETIYTPVSGNGTGTGPQEFVAVSGHNQLTPTPEPSFIAGLAVDLLFVVGLVGVFRRRASVNR